MAPLTLHFATRKPHSPVPAMSDNDSRGPAPVSGTPSVWSESGLLQTIHRQTTGGYDHAYFRVGSESAQLVTCTYEPFVC